MARDRDLLILAAAAAAVVVLSRRAPAGGAPSGIIPAGTPAFIPPSADLGGSPVAQLAPRPGGGFIFPTLPQGAAFTTDPATGSVYIVAIPTPNAPGYVSTSDVVRGG